MTAQFDALRAQAFAALQRGDFANAKKLFKQGFDAGDTHRNTAAGLTYSARHTKDFQLSYDAAEAWLKLEPHSWEALLLKADALEGLGKFLDASTFYSAAIGVAPPYDQATPNARAELDRAQARVRQATARYQSHLSDVMTAAGFDPGDGSSRMAQALDIAAGRKSHYFQQPLKFFFPELPQRQFYHRSEFDWAPSIEAALPQIIEEAINVLAEDGLFEPYIQHNPRAPSVADLSLVDNNDWAAVHLIRDGEILEENAARVPSIMKALDAAPLPNVPGLAPSVLLSRLKPGMHITPHTGLTNARLL
ncbi:MAG: aspartyl/asparaginyl beta-hydroxylase domain-containing protein, partial [Maricaulaceae bacterium]